MTPLKGSAGRNMGRNPREPQSRLYQVLTRTFSGPLVNWRAQVPHQLKRRQLDKYKFSSASGKTFKRSQFYDPFANLRVNQMLNQNRAERYVDFNQMEFVPELAAAFDIYADEITTSTILSPILKIKSKNEEIGQILNSLFYEALNIESQLFYWVRTMCKFGDFFLYLDIDEKLGIINTIGLPPEEIERLEGMDKTNPNYVQFQWNSGGITFENWQIAHFRILGNDKYSPYGASVVDAARRIWRQLDLLENAVMAYRIVRSPERRVFYIDVAGIDPDDVETFMEQVKQEYKKHIVVDQESGRADARYNPLAIEEDYFIPVRGNTSATKIDTLPGGHYTGDIDDIKYLRDKLFTAIKIPASYLSRADGGDEDKESLAQKDIRFARTTQRLQRVVVGELNKIALIHLFTLGYRGEDLLSFELSLNNPSKVAEMQEFEQWRSRFELANQAKNTMFSDRWVARHIFDISEEERLRLIRERYQDARLEKELEVIRSGEGSEGSVGDLDIGDIEDFEKENTEEFADTEGTDSDEEDVLLAAPGKRDTNFRPNLPHTTPGAKGKLYYPEKTDKRDLGAFRRHMHGLGSREMASNTPRNVWPGMKNINRMSKGIISEEQEKEMLTEEKSILRLNHEVSVLLETLKDDARGVNKNEEADLRKKTQAVMGALATFRAEQERKRLLSNSEEE